MDYMAMSPEEKREKKREQWQKWYKRNPRKGRVRDPQKARDQWQDWYQRNKDKVNAKPRKSTEESRQKACERTKAWLTANKERAHETKKKWRLEHPEENLERKRASYLRCREQEIQRRRERYRANPEPALKKCKEWHDAHKDRRQTEEFKERACEAAKRCDAKRRAAKVKAGGSFTKNDIERLYADQGGKCAACETPFKTTGTHRYHIDHIIPLRPADGSKPGSNGPENLQLLCRPCNCSKYNLSQEEFKRRRENN